MVDDHILRFNVSMHDADGVSIMKSFENLVDVILAVRRGKYGNEIFVFGGLDVLKN